MISRCLVINDDLLCNVFTLQSVWIHYKENWYPLTGITVFNAQNCGIHQSGITVLCFRNDGSESSGILTHRRYLSYNKDAFLSWAESAGSSVSAVIRQFLEAGKEPEQGYKYCVSLMKAADRYGLARVDAACE